MISVVSDNTHTVIVKSIAIKSGCRYVDEMASLLKTNFNEAYLESEKDPEAAVKKKEQ
jgi:hypothetical protein